MNTPPTKPEHPRSLRILCHGWYDKDARIGYPRGKIIYWEQTTPRLRQAFADGETYYDREEQENIPICEAVYESGANPVQEFKRKEERKRKDKQKWGLKGKKKEYPDGGDGGTLKKKEAAKSPIPTSRILKRPLRPGESHSRLPGNPVASKLPQLPPETAPVIPPITILEAKYSDGLVRAVDLGEVAKKIAPRGIDNPEKKSG